MGNEIEEKGKTLTTPRSREGGNAENSNCSRNGCEETMCERYSHIHGYICEDCFLELVGSSVETGVETDIENFLASQKGAINYALKELFRKYDKKFPP